LSVFEAKSATEVSAGPERVGRITPDNTGAASGKYNSRLSILGNREDENKCLIAKKIKQKLRLQRRITRLWSRKMRQWCRKVRLWSRKMLIHTLNCSFLLKVFFSFQKFCRAFHHFVVVVFCNVWIQSCIWLRLTNPPFLRQSCIWLRLLKFIMFFVFQRKSCVWSRFSPSYFMRFVCFKIKALNLASGRTLVHNLASGRILVQYCVRSHISLPNFLNKKHNFVCFPIFFRRIHILYFGMVPSHQIHGLLFPETRNYFIKPHSHRLFENELAVTIFNKYVVFMKFDSFELMDLLSFKMNKIIHKLKPLNRFNKFVSVFFKALIYLFSNSFENSQNGNRGKLKIDYG
jgi:hypothetical protein